jgi:hypothetical protein
VKVRSAVNVAFASTEYTMTTQCVFYVMSGSSP